MRIEIRVDNEDGVGTTRYFRMVGERDWNEVVADMIETVTSVSDEINLDHANSER